MKNEFAVNASGLLTGRRLGFEPRAGRKVAITLPPESFVSPVVGDVIVYGWHSPTVGSEIRAISVDSGCDLLLLRLPDAVRSALLDRSGGALYVHAVAAADRRDLGVTRHELATGHRDLVVGPLPSSEVFGPTFATELRWSVDGEALAVQSCGMSACRTRVLDVTTGVLSSYEGSGHGALVGVTADRLYVFDRCHWSPCRVLAIDLDSGVASEIAEEAFSASLVTEAGRQVLRIDTAAGRQEVTP
ncbi:MAG TPA: hypothetical protein VK992_03370 [Candidatus Caenarcaniphilales bacterium]|nr:hypothetical protein [Candidatus Caenarcaniphilales bacterium]